MHFLHRVAFRLHSNKEGGKPLHFVGACFDELLYMRPDHVHKELNDKYNRYNLRMVNVMFDLGTVAEVRGEMQSEKYRQGMHRPHQIREAKSTCESAYNPDGEGVMYSFEFNRGPHGPVLTTEKGAHASQRFDTDRQGKTNYDSMMRHIALYIKEGSGELTTYLNEFLSPKFRTRSFAANMYYPLCYHRQPTFEQVTAYLQPRGPDEKLCLFVHGKGLRPVTRYTGGRLVAYHKNTETDSFDVEDVLYALMGMDFYWGLVPFSTPAASLACDTFIYYKYNSEDESYMNAMIHHSLPLYASHVYSFSGFLYAHSMGNLVLGRSLLCSSKSQHTVCESKLKENDIRGGRPELTQSPDVNRVLPFKWIDGAGPLYGAKSASGVVEQTCIKGVISALAEKAVPDLSCSLSAVHLSHRSALPRTIFDSLMPHAPLYGLICGSSKIHRNKFLKKLGYGGLGDMMGDIGAYLTDVQSDNCVSVNECLGPYGAIHYVETAAVKWVAQSKNTKTRPPNLAWHKVVNVNVGNLINKNMRKVESALQKQQMPFYDLHGTHRDTMLASMESASFNIGEQAFNKPALFAFCAHLLSIHNIGCDIRHRPKRTLTSVHYSDGRTSDDTTKKIDSLCWKYCAQQQSTNLEIVQKNGTGNNLEVWRGVPFSASSSN